MHGSDWFGLTAEYPATTTPWVFSENSQRKPISVETQMVFWIRLETLFQLNNVVPFLLVIPMVFDWSGTESTHHLGYISST